MDVWDDTTAGNGSLDEGIEFFVTSNGELQMSGCNSLHLKVLASVSSELQDLSGQVFEDSCSIDGRSSSDSAVCANSALQESVNSANGELNKRRCEHG